MSNIKIIVSNFLDVKSHIEFEGQYFKYKSKKSNSEFKLISLKEIKTLTYEKPSGAKAAMRQAGLIAILTNFFSALISMKKGMKIEFNVHFKDKKYFVGVTEMDEYFNIQNAWLEVK